MENKLVSIIITTHDRPLEILKRALNSALRQDYLNKEIIIINDNPNFIQNPEIRLYVNNLSQDIVYKEIDNKIKNANYSRNYGFKLSKGEFLAFLDDDDEWFNNKISSLIPIFDDETAIVYCDYEIDGKKEKRRKKIHKNATEELLKQNYIGGCSIPIISRKKFIECGFFDETMPSCQDIELWIRLSLHGKIKYCDQKLVKYYISSNSITSSPEKRIKGWEYLIQKNKLFFEKHKIHEVYWLNNILEIKIMFYGFNEGLKYLKRYSICQKVYAIKAFIRGIIKRFLYKRHKRER